jgi:hypothetical protein
MSTPSGLVNIFPNNGGNTHALFIGDNGFMGGYYTKSLSGRPSSWHGAIWTIDPKDPRKIRETDLPQLANVSVDAKASGSFPFDFNQLGQAAGYQVGDLIGQHAVFWDGDARHTIVDLGVFGQERRGLDDHVGIGHQQPGTDGRHRLPGRRHEGLPDDAAVAPCAGRLCAPRLETPGAGSMCVAWPSSSPRDSSRSSWPGWWARQSWPSAAANGCGARLFPPNGA